MEVLEGGWENLEGHTLCVISCSVAVVCGIFCHNFFFWHLSTSVGSKLMRNTVRCTVESLISFEQTALGRKKGAQNWGWLLTGK